MPGLGGRMSTVIKAKISKLLDRAEDPAETLDYGYQKQLELLQNVKKGIADVVTSKKRLQMQSQKLEQTIVRYAVDVWSTVPLRTSSDSTRTPTSIEVRQAAFTDALTVTRCPTNTGWRKVMRSIAAVTTRVPQWRMAAIPATSSQSFMIDPPCTLPAVFASMTPIQCVSTASAGGRGFTDG